MKEQTSLNTECGGGASLYRIKIFATIRVITILCTLVSTFTYRAQAQLTVPALDVVGSSVRSTTAAELINQLRAKEARIEAGISVRQQHYPIDSMLSEAKESVAGWLVELQKRPIKGIQLDPYGYLSVAAGNEANAKAQIAERLATPKLSLNDRAYTYPTAVRAFANWHYPDRLPTAESYLKELNAMGDVVALKQFGALISLQYAYYMLGRSADVARLGTQALLSVGRMHFKERERFFLYGTSVYTMTVEALAGLTDGQARIAALNAELQAAKNPSQALVTLDSGFKGLGRFYTGNFEKVVAINALLGRSASPLVGNYWMNRPSNDSATLQMNDGKLRIVYLASIFCPGCMQKVVELKRIQEQNPAVEIIFLTHTVGAWSNRLVEPTVEAQGISAYLAKKKIDYPVGIYYCPKVLNEDGGMTPADSGPNVKNYADRTLFMIDGRGKIRRIFATSGRDLDIQVARTVRFLTAETTAQIGQ